MALNQMSWEWTHLRSLEQNREQIAESQKYLGPGVEVADGIGFKVIFILPAEHRGDDDNNECYHTDGGQHCSDYPKIVGRVLDHSWKRGKQEIVTFDQFIASLNTSEYIHSDKWHNMV